MYDQAGNKTQVLTPRAVAAGFSTTSSCVATLTCPFTWVTKYNQDNQVSAQVQGYNPADPVYNTPSETDYTYDNAGRLSAVSAPPSNGQTVRNVNSYTYFPNGWVSSTTDPWSVTTNYLYTNEGQQSARTLIGGGGDMTRSQSQTYFPDGKLATVTDNGVPTGLYSELVDNSDTGNVSSAGTWTTATTGSRFWGYNYQKDVNGTTSDSFTWNLHAPQSGSYSIYAYFPAVSGAVTNASYKVNYSGGSATVTIDQTKNTGSWVKLGTWALSSTATNESVLVAGNSGGTVVADAIKAVRDNSGDTNTAQHTMSYGYDADGNQTSISDTSKTGAAVTSYTMTYDQLDRQTMETEANSSSTLHTTAYGYDAASNMTSRTHDAGLPSPANPSYATYTYNNLNQVTNESDGTSASDPSPQVTTFTYTPDGQTASEGKPNNNTLTDTYFANNQLQQSLEKTSAGAIVAQHVYQYDPNGNTTSNAETLMSADTGSPITHTYTYTYDPMDRISTVLTDGSQTESYQHDPNGNVTQQTIGTSAPTTFTYDRNRLLQASASGVAASYNYDPLGRLDTVTSGTTIQQSNTYDGFDNLQSVTTPSGSTSYSYDSLNRMTSQTSGTTTTNFSYLGTSSDLTTESTPTGTVTKSYTYTPWDQRLSQAQHSGGTLTYGYYSYNNHNDVEAVTGPASSGGTTTATYGYTAYGQPLSSMFTGADKSNVNPGPTVQPYSTYRYNAMRWDSGTGQYDMGFRNYNSGLNQFLTRDMYDGALANQGLTADPFTGSPYAFGEGNPISNIEFDGHMPCIAGGPCGSIQYLEHWSASQPTNTNIYSGPTMSAGPPTTGKGTRSGGFDWTTLLWQDCGGPCDATNVGDAAGSLGASTYPLVKNLSQLRVLNRLGNYGPETSPILKQMKTTSPWAYDKLQTDVRTTTNELTSGGEFLSKLGRGLTWAGPVIGGLGEYQATGSNTKAAEVAVGDAGVNVGAAAAGSWVAGTIAGAEEGALVGEAVGPEGAIVGAVAGAAIGWVASNGISDLVNSGVGQTIANGVSDVWNSIF